MEGDASTGIQSLMHRNTKFHSGHEIYEFLLRDIIKAEFSGI